MKTWILLFSTLSVLSGSVARAESAKYAFSETRNYQAAFGISPQAAVDISNKYGQVVFTNWDKDSVKIEVEVISEGDRMDRVMQNLSYVRIDFTGTGVYVQGRTQWGAGTSLFKRTVQEIKQSLKGSQRVEVNYKVYLPKTCDINIDNHFGDVYMTDVEGSVQADVSHGNFRANKIHKIRRLKMRHGDTRIRSVKTASMDVAFGDLEINVCDDLDLTSSTTDVIIESVEDINLVSKNDRIDIKNVNAISGRVVLGDVRLGLVRSRVTLSSHFGSLRIKSIDPGFAGISLDGNTTEYTILVKPDMNSAFKVTLIKSKEFSYDRHVTIKDTKQEEDDVNIYRGGIGASSGVEKIVIYSKGGQVRFES